MSSQNHQLQDLRSSINQANAEISFPEGSFYTQSEQTKNGKWRCRLIQNHGHHGQEMVRTSEDYTSSNLAEEALGVQLKQMADDIKARKDVLRPSYAKVVDRATAIKAAEGGGLEDTKKLSKKKKSKCVIS